MTVLKNTQNSYFCQSLCFTFGYVLKAPRLTFPAEIVRVGSICRMQDTVEQENKVRGHSILQGLLKSGHQEPFIVAVRVLKIHT